MVFVIGCSDEVFPSPMTYRDIEKNHPEIETTSEIKLTAEWKQEVNAMYVAQTRAEKVLFMMHTSIGKAFRGGGIIDVERKLSPLLVPALKTIQDKGRLILNGV